MKKLSLSSLLILFTFAFFLGSCTNAAPTVIPTEIPPQATATVVETIAPPIATDVVPQITEIPVIKNTLAIPSIDGKTLLETRCVACHSLNTTTRRKGSQDAWNQVVQQMVYAGATLNSEEQQILVQYLADNFGN
ncbi:MAG: hypothetical protein NTZ74_14305 [Chloroflexi bacterium]|nr:hypothetical protein [Chloroflexota bacterium]